MMSNQFEQLPADQLSLPAGIEENLPIEIAEPDTDKKDGVRTNSWLFPPEPPKKTKPVNVNWPLPSIYLTDFQANQHAATPKGTGYLIQATFIRNPFYLVGERTRSVISPKDRMYMAYWCSGKTHSWYCQQTRKFYQGNQTNWLPVLPSGGSVGAVWLPGAGYDPHQHTVVHSVLIMRVRGNRREHVVWQSANGAPAGYTGHPILRPKNPADHPNFNIKKNRVEYKISRNNPRGLELWAGPKYRRRL